MSEHAPAPASAVVSPAQPDAAGYGLLARQIRASGLMRKRPWTYATPAAVLTGALGATVAVMVAARGSWWLLLLAPVMAVIATQTSFLGHDIGHLQVTRDARRSRLLGLLAGNLLSGLSYGWWVRKHNAHHAHPNDPDTDPDVRAGVLVFTATEAEPRRGAAAWLTRHQALLFFPLLLGEAGNLHVASVRALVSPGLRLRAAEATLLLAHFVAYVLLLVLTLSWVQALAFVAVQKGLQGLYLGCSFAPNHKGMPVLDAEQASDPLLRQVLTSRNVRGGPVVDVLLGGLNYQVEHHLFPSMPRANLRHAQPIVRAFCAERRIPYVECSLVASYAAAVGHLHAVGAPLRESSSGADALSG